jgi:hypothetical protein
MPYKQWQRIYQLGRYNGFFTIVLFALVDANYNFMVLNVECQGRIYDHGVSTSTDLCKELENEFLNFFHSTPLNERQRTQELPYFILGDEAFAMFDESVFGLYYAKVSQ